jgi:hypothetical protein
MRSPIVSVGRAAIGDQNAQLCFFQSSQNQTELLVGS